MVPLCEISDFFKENRFLFLGLGQSLRLVLKTTQYGECIIPCFSAGQPVQDYSLSNLGVFMSYIPVDQQGSDLQNILRSRIEMRYERQIPFQIMSAV